MKEGKTFEVAPVEKNKPAFPSNSVSEIGKSFVQYWQEKEEEEKKWEEEEEKEKMKQQEEEEKGMKQLEFEVGVVNHKNLVKSHWHLHGFLNAVLTAYNGHYPLILSPDDFWLLISLAISKFIGNDKNMAEKYRYTFVEHEGQKELVVDGIPFGICPKSPKSNREGWPMFVAEICKLIKAETKTDISDIMATPFSTTGPTEQAVMGVTLMEAMKNYFSYKCLLLCGIPEITLEGTTDDYQSIIDRTEKLEKIVPDLACYFSRVRSHVVKIRQSAEGNVDNEFWRTMVLAIPEGSGGQCRFTGWLADFVFFSKNHWKSCDFDDCNSPAVTLTPFKLDDQLYTMKVYNMKLVAGFLGTAIDEKNSGAVRPAIGWMTYYEED